MDFRELQKELIGKWRGKNLLQLSWLTPTDYFSDTELTVAPVASNKSLTFAYTWSHENVPHEGVLLLGYDNKQAAATAAWVDSWHQGSRVMPCQGTIGEQGTIDLLGYYEAPPGPDWGWRIVIAALSEETLQLTMYNRSPEDDEELAMQAEYNRSSGSA